MLFSYLYKNTIEAGCDEAGRGCLAGAVFAAAVVWPPDLECKELNDSKKLSEKQRNALRPFIEKNVLAWAIGVVSPQEIDRINILNASFLAMHRALDCLNIQPQHLLIDGNRFKQYKNISHTTIVKGDGKYLSIAAASVLAKTHRDEYMLRLHEEFPLYEWNRNKAYPTKNHYKAIEKFGITHYHRMSYSLLSKKQSLSLF
jgi:ribonuclease HII